MSPKELMIDDWVLLNNKPYQLKSGKEIDELASKVKPIPISEDFMKSQGYEHILEWRDVFKLNREGVDCLAFTTYYLDVCGLGDARIYACEGHNNEDPSLGELRKFIDGKYDDSHWICECNNVHELQHFIKITELIKQFEL